MRHGAFGAAIADVAGGIVAAVVLVAPVVYAAFRTDRFGRRASFPVAVTVALAGLFVGGVTDLVVGWVPVVGRFVSPLAWAYAVKHLGDAEWPPALLLGATGWILTVLFFAALGAP